jgi:parallel beta-helix repeat protein
MARFLIAAAATLAVVTALVTLAGRGGHPANGGVPASLTVNTSDDHNGHQLDDFLSLREAVRLATGDLAVIDLSEGECMQVEDATYPDACETTRLVGAPYANPIFFEPAVFAPFQDPLIEAVAPFDLHTDGTTIDANDATVVVHGGPSFACFSVSGSESMIAGLTITGCRTGVALTDGSGNTIERNTIGGHQEHGIRIDQLSSGNTVEDNLVGTDVLAAELGNGLSGVFISASDGNVIRHNTIANNGSSAASSLGSPVDFDNSGITIDFGVANDIEANVFRENAGLAIDLGGDGVSENDAGDADAGANRFQNFPDITEAVTQSPFRVAGFLESAAGVSYRLDLYENDVCDPSGYGEGSRFLGSQEIVANTSPSPYLEFINVAVTPGKLITATATNLDTHDTSELSQCFAATPPGGTPTPSPSATPTPTPTSPPPSYTQGDVDCDGDIDVIDVLKLLAYLAGLAFPTPPGCPPLGGALPAGGEPQLFGDVDCDGDVDAVDALQILRHIAGLPPHGHPLCPAIGQKL